METKNLLKSFAKPKNILLVFLIFCSACIKHNDEQQISSVTICNQKWMVKNLDVSVYRNGDSIPRVTNAAIWDTLTSGAWCYYNNDPGNGLIYGKLYNWYAINDQRGLAPDGWHIASDSEWTALTLCLGGQQVAGGKMKETGTDHWSSPNINATDSSGFNALPSGYRFWDGSFYAMGTNGYWWSSTDNGNSAFTRYLEAGDGTIFRTTDVKKTGYPVRCIKNY